MSINSPSIDTLAGYVAGIDSFQDCAIFPAMKPPTFHPIPLDQLPQDPKGDGAGWIFKTLEHDEHSFPHAIEARDAAGRKCVYVVLGVEGVIGEWQSE